LAPNEIGVGARYYYRMPLSRSFPIPLQQHQRAVSAAFFKLCDKAVEHQKSFAGKRDCSAAPSGIRWS
jgi:hypothetical protein